MSYVMSDFMVELRYEIQLQKTLTHEKDPNVGSLTYVNVAKKTMKKTL